ncbi:MAG: fimbrial protein [Bauldia sp.]
MANPNLDDADEKPLDPAVARVQARLRRLLLIAGLTLGIGILAVFAGIIYRLSTFGDKAQSAPPQATLAAEAAIPAGARLVSSNLDGNRIVLTYEHAGGTTLILVDVRSLSIVGRLDLRPGAAP